MVVPERSSDWHAISDGWQVAITSGEFYPSLHLRSSPIVQRKLPVVDSRGRTWHAPAVLAPDGSVAIPQPMVKIDGQWRRHPTVEQSAVINAALTARSELSSGRVAKGELPLEAAADIACTLLESMYHLSAEVLSAPFSSALLDDELIVHVMAASSGFIAEE